MGAMAVLWSFLGVLKHLLAPPLRCLCLLRLNSGGQSTQIKYLSKSTDTYSQILLQ